ncbi:MAG TPA: universal stress protein, partial [Jatrophihabitans sp.]|nr:universal stress protein [Jatrophihabitans sp.]
QARRWGCILEAVTCWLPYLLDAQSLLKSAPAEDRVMVRQRLADQLQPWREKFPAIEVVGTVSQQRPAIGLLERGSGHDLLVLGRPGSHPVRAALGSVHLAVLRHADCPVALVPTDPR